MVKRCLYSIVTLSLKQTRLLFFYIIVFDYMESWYNND